MVTPAGKRDAVAHACEKHGVSQRRACEVLSVDRSSMRYRDRGNKKATFPYLLERELIDDYQNLVCDWLCVPIANKYETRRHVKCSRPMPLGTRAVPIDYLNQFPIPEAALPPRLRGLLEPVGDNPALRVNVTTRLNKDYHGPNREYLHMIMAAVPEAALGSLGVPRATEHGVVSFSVPSIDAQGGLPKFVPSISGHDYIVASWGDGSFYGYALAEKVWMSLGLSPRVLGGEQQRIIYDDLSLPELGVAEGETSTRYYFSAKRDVHWTMSNEYLRRYLWMRGMHGVRMFFYKARLPDGPELRSIMSGEAHVHLSPAGEWYRLDIREFKGSLLIQVWASVATVTPDLCPEQTAEGLNWPDVAGPMTHQRADAMMGAQPVYLDDRFLEKYEQSGFFESTPVNVNGKEWHCGPSYPVGFLRLRQGGSEPDPCTNARAVRAQAGSRNRPRA